MSLAYTDKKINVVKVLDPLLNVNKKRDYICLESGSAKLFRYLPADSYSQSSITFNNINPPSVSTLWGRHLNLRYRVQVTLTGTNSVPGANLIQASQFSFRAYPISSSIASASITLNGHTITRQLNKYVLPLMRLHNNHNAREIYESTAPTMLDNCQNYTQVQNSLINPIGDWQSATIETTPRGSFVYESFVNTPTSCTIIAILEESVKISPFIDNVSYQEAAALYNISDVNFNISLDPNLEARMLSICPNTNTTLTGISVTFIEKPQLKCLYMEPNLLSWPSTGPSINYPYCEHRVYESTGPTVPPGGNWSFTSSNIQLGTIPDLFVIYMARQDSDLTPYAADAYAGISQVQVNWNTKTFLNSADQVALYKLSVAAGYRGSWSDWSGYPKFSTNGNVTSQVNGQGSLLVLRASELGFLESSECEGMLKNVTFNLNISGYNPNPLETITYVLRVVACYEGVFSVDDTRVCTTSIGVVSALDYLDAPMTELDYNHIKHMQELEGGGFWDTLKSVGSTVFNGLESLLNGPIGKLAVPLIGKRFGLGMSGGKIASREDLEERLLNYKQ